MDRAGALFDWIIQLRTSTYTGNETETDITISLTHGRIPGGKHLSHLSLKENFLCLIFISTCLHVTINLIACCLFCQSFCPLRPKYKKFLVFSSHS